MSRRPRRRKLTPEPEPEHEPADAVEVTPRERLDPRAFVDPRLPQRHEFADAAAWAKAVLAWAEHKAPEYVRTDAQALAERASLNADRRYWRACRDARRRGLPRPDVREFFPGFTSAAVRAERP
jgi:hypothetical protein